VDWGPDEKARNLARRGKPVKLHTRILDYMQEGGHLSQADREKIKTTNLERVLKSQLLKDSLGIEAEKGGQFRIIGDESRTVRTIAHLLDKLKAAKVGSFYLRDERDDWIEAFLGSVPQASAAAKASSTVNRPTTKSIAVERARLVKPRDKLIPPSCLLRVKDARVRRIENELRDLFLEDFPNAISVLFRVFVELSVDWYITNNPSAAPAVKPNKIPGKPPREPSLTAKIEAVAAHLVKNNALSAQDAKPVRRACQRDSFLAPSIVLLNLYVHNFQMSPSPTDLRAQWDNLQPFVEAMWPRT
jgi:hypothetical protein